MQSKKKLCKAALEHIATLHGEFQTINREHK